jgi:hypothetical protein
VADPACDRGNAGLQYLFVNGRWVRDRGLAQALQEAYRGLLLTGRHPVASLFVELPPEDVDVNVHPTKAEVRFRDPQAVQQLVREAVHDRLRAEELTARRRGCGRAMLVFLSGVLLGGGVYLLWPARHAGGLMPGAQPRPVTARGDLAAD